MKRERWAAIVIAAMGAAGAARADDLPSCSSAELSGAHAAPMPKAFASIRDVKTNKPRMAGYLIDIGRDGAVTVRCAIDAVAYGPIREDAASAVGRFRYWPEDSTDGGGPVFVHVQSGSNGLKIPSVLPRKTDPPCDPAAYEGENIKPEPIYKPKAVYPLDQEARGLEGSLTVILTVEPSGAVSLDCRGGGDNSDSFMMAGYYYAAQMRFPTHAGPPYHYSLTIKYRLD